MPTGIDPNEGVDASDGENNGGGGFPTWLLIVLCVLIGVGVGAAVVCGLQAGGVIDVQQGAAGLRQSVQGVFGSGEEAEDGEAEGAGVGEAAAGASRGS